MTYQRSLRRTKLTTTIQTCNRSNRARISSSERSRSSCSVRGPSGCPIRASPMISGMKTRQTIIIKRATFLKSPAQLKTRQTRASFRRIAEIRSPCFWQTRTTRHLGARVSSCPSKPRRSQNLRLARTKGKSKRTPPSSSSRCSLWTIRSSRRKCSSSNFNTLAYSQT